MHSSSYLLSLPALSGVNAKTVVHAVVAAQEADTLRRLARQDAIGQSYSGLLSLAQGVSGVHAGRFAWSTVKLYYATFYLFRAALLLSGWCIFHVNGKPRAVEALPGRSPIKLDGTTHEACYKLFEAVFPRSPLVSQEIGVVSAGRWMRTNREMVNYNLDRFPDPTAPAWFEFHQENSVRRAVLGYLEDPYAFAFLEDHAMIAYPIAAAVELRDSAERLGVPMGSHEDVRSISKYWRDSSGQLPGLVRLVYT